MTFAYDGEEDRTPDAARAWRVLDHIRANPEHHDQADFINLEAVEDAGTPLGRDDYLDADQVMGHCGTTACFAGWTVLLDGQGVNRFGLVETAVPGGFVDVEWEAARLLGVNYLQANALFYEAGDLAEVEATVRDVFGERPDAQ